MIDLINVSKSYPGKSGNYQALKGINLHINAGEVFGVIGKSGAGKSTLLRCLNFLEQPSSGSIKIDSQDLSQLNAAELRKARHKISMVFQNFNLLSQRTVYQNIALPLELMGYGKQDIDKTVTPLLVFTDLESKKNNYPTELSGGQKQRVAIARALASKPKILLCDEPTSGLDQQTTHSILQLFRDINQKLGVTIFIISHELDVIKQICDRVALIHDGELIEENNVYDMFSAPQVPITQQVIRSTLTHELPDGIQQKLSAIPTDNNNPILRIMFHGKATAEPIIANLMESFSIKLNILQANIEYLKDDMLGIMISEVVNHTGNLENGIAYLEKNGLGVEVIGYVKRNA